MFSSRTRCKRSHLTRKCVDPDRNDQVDDVMHDLETWELNARHLQFFMELGKGPKAGHLVETALQENEDCFGMEMEDGDANDVVTESVLRLVETGSDPRRVAMDFDRLEGEGSQEKGRRTIIIRRRRGLGRSRKALREGEVTGVPWERCALARVVWCVTIAARTDTGPVSAL